MFHINEVIDHVQYKRAYVCEHVSQVMKKYIVQQGDCVESIAVKNGFFWETIWNDPENSALKRKRKNPNLLLPGDSLVVPDKSTGSEDIQTERRVKFKVKGVPSKLRVVLQDVNGEPYVNTPYVLVVDAQSFSGKTNSQGLVEHSIAPSARKGKLYLGEELNIEYELRLGFIDPITEFSGIKSRLSNLGYQCSQSNDPGDPDNQLAVRRFQYQHHLEETGVMDDKTRDKIQELYGC